MDNPKYPALTTVANFPLFPVLSITSTTATTMMSANITSQGGPTPHALDLWDSSRFTSFVSGCRIF